MNNIVIIQARDAKEGYRISYFDLRDSFEVNYQLNSNYEVSFTLVYTERYKDVFNAAKPKAYVFYNGQQYVIQQTETNINEHGYLTLRITANHALIDKMKNVRLDKQEPTEDHPEVTGGSAGTEQDPNKPDIVVKKTAEKQYYTLEDRLKQFFNGNDQGIKYELHGNFPKVAVDTQDSLYEWLTNNLKDFNAYFVPDGDVLKIYDLQSIQHKTGKQFRYLNNMTEADLKTDENNLVNDCLVYGGKMEKDITFINGVAGSGGGSVDSTEAFCKSPINADFGVNKDQMLASFQARSQRVHAWGVDVNRLYDTVKNAGVSPAWFFAYELQEQGTYYGWLNHTYRHGDAYQDAVSVCNWIKQTAQSATIHPAWSAPEGSMAPNQALANKWNQEFGKGSIGRVYLQGTAAATWDLAGVTPNPRIGKPITGCVSVIRSWGGHTVQATQTQSGGGWGWPFPSVGEGKFLLGQTFGTHPQDGVGRRNGFHDGLDFGSIDHPGSEVHAIHGGKVTVSRDYVAGVGYYVVIQDSTGLNVEYQEAFGSPSDIFVSVGDTVQLGQIIGRRTTNHIHIGITRHSFREAFSHAFSDDGTWLDPLSTIKSGIAPGGGQAGQDGTTTSSTTQVYYSLFFHYEDGDSINHYGRHRGKTIVMDSIYDMNELKKYVDATVQHNPETTLSLRDIYENSFAIGDVWRVIAPELTVNYDLTLLGIKYKPFSNNNKDATLSFNNTGLAMQSIIHSIYSDIRGLSNSISQFDMFGTGNGRSEDRWANLLFTNKQMNDLKEVTKNGGEKKSGTTD